MDDVVYLDHKAKELENLQAGIKDMIIRGDMGRKLPYGRVKKGDALYFVENKGDALVKAKANIASVFESEKLSKEDSINLVEESQERLLLNTGMMKRFAGKRYVILLELKDFEALEAYKIDRSDYGNMDDWLPVENIKKVKLK